MGTRTGCVQVGPTRAKSNILAISIIRHPSKIDRGFQHPKQRWKPLQLNPIRCHSRARFKGYVMVSTDHFRREIRSRLELATTRGGHDLTIDSGELYKALSQRPVFGPWMIFCCNAMRAEMTTADNLIFDDAKETLLTINYRLPRNQKWPVP